MVRRSLHLVTGGCGFIGSHLVDALLDAGKSVRVVDDLSVGRRENLSHREGHENLDIRQGSVTDGGNVNAAMRDVTHVYHLAALADIVPSIVDPDRYFAANVHGTYNVVQAARTQNVERFIYAASSSCYGIPEIYPTPETSPVSPQYPYALTKYLGEQIVLHWAQVYELPAVALRFFNVYGPRARTSGTYGAMFGVFLAQKFAGKPLTIVGDGSQTRDFTYVSDAVAAILTAAEYDLAGDFFNIGSGAAVAVNRIAELLECDQRVTIPKRPGEPDCTFANITKFQNACGWEPKINIETGVELMLANIDHWADAPIWTPASIAEATEEWFKYLDDKTA